MIRRALRGLAIVLTACGSTSPAPRRVPPNAAESGATPADPVIGTVAIDAPPVVLSMPAELLLRPGVAGTGALLFLGASARLDAIAITFTGSARQQSGRRSMGLFDFVLTRTGKKIAVHLETEQEKFQAEVVAHGALFVFEQRSDDVFTVVLAAAAAPVELDEPACIGLIDQVGKRGGITETGSTGAVTEEGVLQIRRVSWTAYCGRYTKRVWFSPVAGAGATP